MPASSVSYVQAQGPRPHQQDSGAVFWTTELDAGAGLAVLAVADGLGGHGTHRNAGGGASQLAVQIVQAMLMAPGEPPPLADLLQRAHEALWGVNQSREEDAWGLSTLTLLRVKAGQPVECAWAGDCIAIRIRDGQIACLNFPDNYPGREWFYAEMTAAEYLMAYLRNRVMSCLGSDGDHQRAVFTPQRRRSPEFQFVGEGPVALSGDVYLILSDGAFDPLGLPGVLATVLTCPPDQTLAQAVLQAAEAKGLEDNATVVAYRVP